MADEPNAQTGEQGQTLGDGSQLTPISSDETTSQRRDAVSRVELEKVIRERQVAKQRARNAEQQLAALQKELASTVDERHREDFGVSNPDGNAYAVATGGDTCSSSPSRVDVAAVNDNSDLTEKLRVREIQLASLLRDQQLRATALAAGAVNPDQVVGLLRTRVVMEESSDGQFVPKLLDGQGRPLVDENGTVADVETLVTQYLSEPGNANLLRASLAPGSGVRPAGGPVHLESVPHTLAGFNALPSEARREAAMKMSSRQRKAMLGIAPPENAGYL
ncbi:MAG: hypothetical protein HQ546_01775 [Planctomycetes bacterium]|nr:hypothetical protein [Planctomycetota bacterium]